MLFACMNSNELLSMGKRERVEQDTIDQGENSRVCTDAQRQSQSCNHGKSGALSQHAHAKPQVLSKILKGGEGFLLSIHLFHLLYTSELQQCLSPCLIWRHTSSQIIVDVQLQVTLKLRRNIVH